MEPGAGPEGGTTPTSTTRATAYVGSPEETAESFHTLASFGLTLLAIASRLTAALAFCLRETCHPRGADSRPTPQKLCNRKSYQHGDMRHFVWYPPAVVEM